MNRVTVLLEELYEGETHRSRKFSYGILIFDIATILFIVVTSFIPRSAAIEAIDVVIGLVLLAELIARIWISRSKLRELTHPASLVDYIAIASFLAPVAGEAGLHARYTNATSASYIQILGKTTYRLPVFQA